MLFRSLYRGQKENVAHTEEEICVLMKESHRQGFIDKTELEFVDNVFDFADLSVREIMIPRTEMVCLYLEDSLEENIAVAMAEKLTRYPICDEDKEFVWLLNHVANWVEERMGFSVVTKGKDVIVLPLSPLVAPISLSSSTPLKVV